jgi:hypothetical protein
MEMATFTMDGMIDLTPPPRTSSLIQTVTMDSNIDYATPPGTSSSIGIVTMDGSVDLPPHQSTCTSLGIATMDGSRDLPPTTSTQLRVVTMDGNIDRTRNPQISSWKGSRIPLLPKKMAVARQPTRKVRRRNSFIRTPDSSEELPSPHDSIFEADYFSGTNSDDSYHTAEIVPMKSLREARRRTPSDPRENDENSRVSTEAVDADKPQFLYGHGTVLETITEQKSNSSIGTFARRRSVSELHSLPFLGHRDGFIVAKSPRRQRSLSMDDLRSPRRMRSLSEGDLNNIKDLYHGAVTMIEDTTCKPLQVYEIYAQPKAPIQEPLRRPATPPGMPSWTEHQLRPSQGRAVQVQVRQNRFQRWLGIEPSGITLRSSISESRLRSMSDSIGGTLHVARFRPPKSTYGALDQHPFNRAPVAIATPSGPQSKLPRRTGKRKEVRFTPSATARDSETLALQAAMDATRDTAVSPLANMTTMTSSPSPQLIAPKNENECPHRRGRRAALRALNRRRSLNHAHSSPPSNEYQSILSDPLTCPTPLSSPPRITPLSSTYMCSSQSSQRQNTDWNMGILDTDPITGDSSSTLNSPTAFLMSGALSPVSTARSPSPQRETTALLPKKKGSNHCWKCRLEIVCVMIDKAWEKGAGCLCFVCCGYEIEDDECARPAMFGGYGGRYNEIDRERGGNSRGSRVWFGSECPGMPRREASRKVAVAMG